MQDEQREKQLWDYLDGASPDTEAARIEALIAADPEWGAAYAEMAALHALLLAAEPEEPSLRFTKNVMEEVARNAVAPAVRQYINRRVVWGIGGFFLALLAGLIVYAIAGAASSDAPASPIASNLESIDYTRVTGPGFLTAFLVVNVVLGLMFLDRLLSRERARIKDQPSKT
ncbi:MAG: hypothetical protein JWP27_2009 [Flaviaesturariibacter sp.]|nr:hypothetical protein [Flaviaesturariibacter sp.]